MIIKKKKNKWIILNNSFYSLFIQNLANSKVIDSNSNGSITLESIKKIPLYEWDGLIYCNLYGQFSDWSVIKKYCEKNNKLFLCDNALGLFDRPKKNKIKNNFEVVSFHHTKPWGFGEGGCIICPKNLEHLIKNFINYGSKNFLKYRNFSNNYKISDVSCAFIYQRLENFKLWSRKYMFQYNRVKNLILKNLKSEIDIIENKSSKSPKNYLPLLFKKNVSFNKINKVKKLVLNKYYKPLIKNKKKYPNSIQLYNKIVCFPTHPGLAKIKNDEILKILSSLI